MLSGWIYYIIPCHWPACQAPRWMLQEYLKEDKLLLLYSLKALVKIQSPSAFKQKILFLLATHLCLQASRQNLPLLTSRDTGTGVCCQHLLGSAEEIILPLSLHMVCCFCFCYHITIQAKTTAELASREENRKPPGTFTIRKKCYKKGIFSATDASNSHQGLCRVFMIAGWQ